MSDFYRLVFWLATEQWKSNFYLPIDALEFKKVSDLYAPISTREEFLDAIVTAGFKVKVEDGIVYPAWSLNTWTKFDQNGVLKRFTASHSGSANKGRVILPLTPEKAREVEKRKEWEKKRYPRPYQRTKTPTT